jgi:flagellar biosynthesis GTPase FlhF
MQSSTANATNVYADTGLTATITPSASSSKVLVFVSQAGVGKETTNTQVALRLMRGATALLYF